MKLTLIAIAGALFMSAALPAQAADPKAAEGKGKYLVTATHTPEECLAAMDKVAANKKLLDKVEWGCMSGDHTAYLTTTANSPEDAIKQLPDDAQKNAKAVKLTKLTPAQIKKFHEEAASSGGK
jgi:hypothetical protein